MNKKTFGLTVRERVWSWVCAGIATSVIYFLNEVYGSGPFNVRQEYTEDQIPGLVYADENRKEYLGPLDYYESGVEQKVYLDWKPFGNLDGVITRSYSRNGMMLDDSQIRRPNHNEISTFHLLHYYGKKEYPALYNDLEEHTKVQY